MKASKNLVGAVSAVAMTAGLALQGAIVVQFAAVSAAEAAVVSRIEVRGNQRVDSETVRGYLGISPGKPFSNADIDDAVKRLFATGLFSDVRVNQVGSTLVVEVSQLKVVNQVLFQGNKKIKDAALAAQVQLKPRSTFSQSTLDADVDTVKQAYSRIGRDDATVTAQVIDLGENRVNVVFQITEGDRTKIAAINFVGNHAFRSGRLADVISTKRSTFMSWLSRDDIYDEDRLRADEEALRRFYYNRGYADFQVLSATGDLDPATNKYTITITIDEGERYTFGDINVESTIPDIDSASFTPLLQTHKGDVYSAKDVEDTIVAITERLAGMGYAFAQVTPRGDRNFENHTISVTYAVDQGARTYVERIEIRGNTKTRDYVIRREFDVAEGDAFNQVLIQRAKRRLEALDFFQTVDISTAPGSEPDQVVLIVDVVEKSTGEFGIGVGYTTGGATPGPSVEGSVMERNFLGRGQFIRLSAGGGKDSRDYSISFTEPYFLGRRIAAGFDVYHQTRNYDDYDSVLNGATVRFGLPITEALTTTLAYNYTQEKYEYDDDCLDAAGIYTTANGCDLSAVIRDAIENHSPWTKSSISNTLTYNTIDDMKNPHNGLYATFTTEFAGLGGDASFFKAYGRASLYKTLSEEADIVGLLTLGAGHVESLDGANGLRTFDMFQGSDRMIRGFDFNGIGPYDANTTSKDHLGGTTYFNVSAEAQFPLPGVAQSLGLRGAVFADAATLYGNNASVAGANVQGTSSYWRASVGASLIWASPFGPLRMDYAVPVRKLDTDDVQNFNFSISNKF
ncbi:MAG: outer membrane protein assembly factor BamA [Rhizobiales bacterium]|nr:outer membrane protein assembly factor BamA [Hyphomicrobiales bacterium]